MGKAIDVEAMCVDEAGGSDAAYSLCGRFTPEEFCRNLRETLEHDWGLSNAKGEVKLIITVREVK